MRLDGLTICVTGGMGFVGSHVAKSLKHMGAQVIIVDRRDTDIPDKFYDLFYQLDYSDNSLVPMFDKVDGIVHCAGTSLVGPSIEDPAEYYQNNVYKTIKLLSNIAVLRHKPFIIFSSSAATYGNPVNIPIKEDDPQIPINPYGRTKLMIENILEDYGVAYGLRSYSLRYFNACGADVWGAELGPEPSDTHIIPRLFTDTPFNLFGNDYNTPDGTCVRDYIHVSDLALAHAKAVEAMVSENRPTSLAYNLGTNTGYSNQQLIDAYRKYIDDLDVEVKPRREGDPDELVADASKFMTEFNWKPHFSDLKTIMQSTHDWYDQ